MDGASRMFAAPVEIKLGGKKYRAEGRLARHYGEIEQHMLSLRADPFQVVSEHLDMFKGNQALQEVMVKAAVTEACRMKTVTGPEVQEWMNTVPGTAFVTWLAIREDAPDMTVEKIQVCLLESIDEVTQKLVALGRAQDEAQSLAEDQVTDKLHGDLNRASGEGPVGNSTGPL